jgi:hypothetical protein
VAALALAFGFLLAGALALRHASRRSRYAKDLGDYLAESGARFRGLDRARAESIAERRERVMHLTVGDLIRDPALAGATTQAIAQLRAAAGAVASGETQPPPDAASG